MQGRLEWRNAAVVRARTIADGVRLIEFAVAGPTARFMPGASTTVEIGMGDVVMRGRHVCLPAEPGRVQLVVRADARTDDFARAMWALLEGARVRLSVPQNPFSASRQPLPVPIPAKAGTPAAWAPRLAGVPVRLACGHHSRSRAYTCDAYNDVAGTGQSREGQVDPSAPTYREEQGVRRSRFFVIVNNSFGAEPSSPDRHPFQGRT